MAILLTGAGGFFTTAGKGIFALKTLNTARITTIPPEVNDFLTELNLHGPTIDLEQVRDAVGRRSASWQRAGGDLAVRQTIIDLLVQMIEDDNPQPDRLPRTALLELIKQIETATRFVEGTVVTAVYTPGGSNTGNGIVVTSILRGDGRNQELILAETVEGIWTGTAIQFKGEEPEGDRISAFYPAGSGSNVSLTPLVGGLITNPNFETEDSTASDLPEGWVASVATLGTTLKLTDFEVQRIVVTGPPTAGFYTISVSNTAGDVQTTEPLAFDASGSAVQTAIRALTGFGEIAVSTTGVSPLFTHDITFVGVGGNLALLTIDNQTTGGTYTPSEVTAGTTETFVARGLEFDGDGAELTTIQQLIAGLSPEVPLAFAGAFVGAGAPAAGVLEVALVDGIGGTVINDSEGTANSFTIDVTALSASFAFKTGVFRLPAAVPDIVYLRLRLTTAINVGSSMFVDQVSLAEMIQLYPDARGPFVQAFDGSVPFDTDDLFTIVTTTDNGGEFQDFINRIFGEDDLLLPVSGAGAVIPDSLIS